VQRDYKGIIIEESLSDNRALNNLEIVGFKITKEWSPAKRWHMHTVKVSKKDIEKLSKNIKPRWYMHFWKNKNVIAIFKGKKFEFKFDDKSSWKPAIAHGMSVKIPKEQLDFPID
jgi:hypothetical protein